MIDIMLLSALHTSQVYSLGLSVLVAGFLYFPLRQWLMGKVMPLDSQSVQAFLPTFSALMGSAVFRDEFEQRWQEALRIRFQPLHLSVQPHAVPLAALADNGLHLDVPSLSGVNSYRLTGKQMGMRLFGKNNLKTTTSLLDVARIASNASERRQQAVLTERTRIMHDLHDTVGAKLLTLSHMLPTAKHKQAAQESLQTLRDMINLTLQKAPLTLGESLADWRLEAMECAEATNVELRWQVAPALESLELRPGQTIELLLFVRATLQQMMASATLQQLTVHFSLAEKQLCVRITAADNPLAAVTHTLNFT
jgi:signal transduction histidine kinase